MVDNKLAENATWDQELLQEEIVQLNLEDFDISVLGWDEDEIKDIMEFDGDFDDGISATDGSDQLDEADTMVVVGGYRFKLSREEYMPWKDQIREEVGYEDSDVTEEIKRRLGLK